MYNREITRARNRVGVAIRSGELLRPMTCERCGKAPGTRKDGRSKIQAHHYLGYSEEHRLDVEWLCSSCHGKEHAKDRVKGGLVTGAQNVEQQRGWMDPEKRRQGGFTAGRKSVELGKGIFSPEVMAKRSEWSGFIQFATCPWCGETGRKAIMHRWHFDNCKKKSLVH